MKYRDFKKMYDENESWRLLNDKRSVLLATFLYDVFVKNTDSKIYESDLNVRLDELLNEVREKGIDKELTDTIKSGKEYINDWTSERKQDKEKKGYLTREYDDEKNEYYYSISPRAKYAIVWLVDQQKEKNFIGADARLKKMFESLKDLLIRSETDPQKRIEENEKKIKELLEENKMIKEGKFKILTTEEQIGLFKSFILQVNDISLCLAGLKERFRDFYRENMKKFMQWQGAKGELLREMFNEKYEIENSDEGQSFNAFYHLVFMEEDRENIEEMLKEVLALPAIKNEMNDNPNLLKFMRSWHKEAYPAYQEYAKISRMWKDIVKTEEETGEYRYIYQLINKVERAAINLASRPPQWIITKIDEPFIRWNLIFDRLLGEKPNKEVHPSDMEYDDGVDDISDLNLDDKIDKEELKRRIRDMLKDRQTVNLGTVIDKYNLKYGLHELAKYFEVTEEWQNKIIDEDSVDTALWRLSDQVERTGVFPKIIFEREDEQC